MSVRKETPPDQGLPPFFSSSKTFEDASYFHIFMAEHLPFQDTHVSIASLSVPSPAYLAQSPLFWSWSALLYREEVAWNVWRLSAVFVWALSSRILKHLSLLCPGPHLIETKDWLDLAVRLLFFFQNMRWISKRQYWKKFISRRHVLEVIHTLRPHLSKRHTYVGSAWND